jgi:hypothetical protein
LPDPSLAAPKPVLTITTATTPHSVIKCLGRATRPPGTFGLPRGRDDDKQRRRPVQARPGERAQLGAAEPEPRSEPRHKVPARTPYLGRATDILGAAAGLRSSDRNLLTSFEAH